MTIACPECGPQPEFGLHGGAEVYTCPKCHADWYREGDGLVGAVGDLVRPIEDNAGPVRPYPSRRARAADGETIADMVWSYVARVDEVSIDEAPDVAVARTQANYTAGRYPGGVEAVAAELTVPWPIEPATLSASAWAGKARWALLQRDRAIRSAVAGGASQRKVSAAVGMTQPAIARILEREGAAGTRW